MLSLLLYNQRPAEFSKYTGVLQGSLSLQYHFKYYAVIGNCIIVFMCEYILVVSDVPNPVGPCYPQGTV